MYRTLWAIPLVLGALALWLWQPTSGDVRPPPAPSAELSGEALRPSAAAIQMDAALRARLGRLKALPSAPQATSDSEGSFDATALNRQVVLVTFFASWCGPCREEMDALKTLHEAYAPFGLRVIAVNWFEEFDGLSDRRRLHAYLAQLDPPYPVLAGTEALIRAFGGITRIPTLFAFDREGRPALQFKNPQGATSGAMPLSALSALVGELVASSPSRTPVR